jgi:hypothetical protein
MHTIYGSSVGARLVSNGLQTREPSSPGFRALVALCLLATATAQASTATMGTDLVIGDLVAGGGWQTIARVGNVSNVAVTVNLNCRQVTDAQGDTAVWNPPFQEVTSTQGMAIVAEGTLELHTNSTAVSTTSGWCELTSTASVDGSTVFIEQGSSGGHPNLIGTAEAITPGKHYEIVFDNTASSSVGNQATTISIANPESISTTVFAAYQPTSGAASSTSLVTVPALGQIVGTVSSLFPGTSGIAGTLELWANSEIAPLALQFDNAAFTGAPTDEINGPPLIVQGASTNFTGLWGDIENGSVLTIDLDQTSAIGVSGVSQLIDPTSFTSFFTTGSISGTTLSFTSPPYFTFPSGCESQVSGTVQIAANGSLGGAGAVSFLSSLCGPLNGSTSPFTFVLKPAANFYIGTYAPATGTGFEGAIEIVEHQDGTVAGGWTHLTGTGGPAPAIFSGTKSGSAFTFTTNETTPRIFTGTYQHGAVSGSLPDGSTFFAPVFFR